MSSDDQHGPAVYDDDESNEDKRQSIMSGRNSYNIGSLSEEPSPRDPPEQPEPKNQQRLVDNPLMPKAAEEEKGAPDHHDASNMQSNAFTKKEEASGI